MAVYEAGGEHVPRAKIDWREEDLSAINSALTMQYLRREGRGDDAEYSLTAAGFRAILRPPQSAEF
jgi:hypothetical protein